MSREDIAFPDLSGVAILRTRCCEEAVVIGEAEAKQTRPVENNCE